MTRPRLRMMLSLAVLVAASLGSVLPLCGAMYRCGCTLTRGERECNVHLPGVAHCPWCDGGAKAFVPGYATAMLVAGATLAAAVTRWKAPAWLGALAAAGAYLLVIGLAGLVTAKLMHYSYWFWLTLR